MDVNSFNKRINELENENQHLQNALAASEKKLHEETQKFNKIAALVNSSLNIHDVLENIINELRHSFQIEGVVIMLVNKERTNYTFFKVSFPDYLKIIEEKLINIAFPLDVETGGAMAQAILEKKLYYFPVVDYSTIQNPRNRMAAEAMQIKSNLIMPVIIKGESIGAIMMSSHTGYNQLTDEDIEKLQNFIEHIGAAIHNSLLYEELKVERQNLEKKVKERTADLEKTIKELETAEKELKKRNLIIEKDLSYARKIQLGIIPSGAPEFPGYRLFTSYTPLDKLGGDLFDFIKIDDNMLGVLICDVSGHGVPAAFITTMIKIGMPYNRVIQKNPGVFMDYLRDNLNYHMHGMYFTGAYCVLNRKNHLLTFSNAGHQPIVLLRDNEIQELVADGTVIGFEYNVDFAVEKIKLKKGDRVILYTDGILDASGSDSRNWENIYGKDRFFDFVKKHSHCEPAELVAKLYEDIFNFTETTSFNDDVAIIIIDKTS